MAEKNTLQEMIVILDFGSQYNQAITRKVRELGVYSELHPHSIQIEKLKELNPKGIILSGGSQSINTDRFNKEILSLGIPVLGIEAGMGPIIEQFGGKIHLEDEREYEEVTVKIQENAPLFQGLSNEQVVWMSGDSLIEEVPAGFTVQATSQSQPVAISHDVDRLYAMQFHPEASKTEQGDEILKHYILDICDCATNWTMENYAKREIERIREIVGDKRVLCALSGGVDSSVVAVLIHQAIGEQLTCIFVDHGLLRKGEAESVMKTFGEDFKMNVIKVNATDRFLGKLKGVSDPEEKRKIIGNEFIYVFDDEATKLEGIDYLAQGTLYTDIMESGTETTAKVKSHHNVGGLPEDMKFELIEPLSTLFKDEVRALGTVLGIPDEIVWRQPFPGPGLGIRILGEITNEKLKIVRESDWILREEIRKAGLEREIWQYFTVLPGIRSVGVSDGGRTYDHTIGIRAVNSVDGLTSDWARIPWEVLDVISNRIVHEVEHVNRVVYDITSKPPSTIEWE